MVINSVISQHLSNIELTKDHVLNIFYYFNPNKVHDHDMIYISMLKMYHNILLDPYYIVFKNCIKCLNFQSAGREIEAEKYKNLFFRKISERIVYDDTFTCFIGNNLIFLKQSGFIPGSSCISQPQSCTIFAQPLEKVSKQGMRFQKSQKYLSRYDTTDSYINLSK